MSNVYLFIKIFLFFILTLDKFPQFLSESISICHLKITNLKCPSDQSIIILDARMGHLPELDKENYNKPQWCRKSDLYYNNSSQVCFKSLNKIVSSICTGYSECRVSAIPSQYFLKKDMICEVYHGSIIETSLYLDYECVPKELFFSPEDLDNIHYIGGYMTSIGYSMKKMLNYVDYKSIGDIYKLSQAIPFNIYFKPKLVLERNFPDHLFFQLQILENSISLSNQSSSNQTCQMGELYSNDYYAFIPTNTTTSKKERNQLDICSSKFDMVGQSFGPISSEYINILANANFSSTKKEVLLIKFTTILCPLLFIENAKVIYDHVYHSNVKLSVYSIAIITCKQGFFLLSESNTTKKTFSKRLKCDHLSGLWDFSPVLVKCVNSLLLPSSSSTLHRTIMTTSTFKSTTEIYKATSPTPSTSKSFSITNISTTPIIIPRTSTLSTVTDSSKYTLVWICMAIIIMIILIIIIIFLLRQFIDKMKCSIPFLICFSKLRFKNDTIPHTYYVHNPRTSMRQNFIFDDTTPMTESFNFTLSGNGSCRQSNRTLITRAGSRPTIISGDSMQTSNYIFEPDNSDVCQGDELPTKLPKTSTLTKLMRSASSLRNNSLSRRPKSLSRQSFADRGSNFFDNRFSGSQVPLLFSKRPTNTSNIMDSNHLMCTSDIFSSKLLPKSAITLRRINNPRPYSHSDMQFHSKNKIISPTTDTYLEPTDSFVQPYEVSDGRQMSPNKVEKNSDYMVYDHSQMSSNNPDTTCQSSIIASLSDGNINDEDDNKRFSMISNNYYGIQGPNPRYSNCLVNRTLGYAQNDMESVSNESVYESIDDENMNLNTIDRRNIALPKPPTED